MGCASPKEVSVETKAIDKLLKDDQRTSFGKIKLLLLGSGESGKSTFAKQLKLIHMGFSDDECKHFKDVIHENVNYCLFALLKAANANDIKFSQQNQDIAQAFIEEGSLHLDEASAKKIKDLMEDPSWKQIMGLYSTFHLPDSAQYFLNDVERIADPKYLPTTDDVLHCRAKTTGIQELNIEQDKKRFTVIDVGGQRSERKKWVHCFEDVTAIIFFVAISEYDLFLFEDRNTNRMHESLKLFDEICNSKWFGQLPIMLFLNKKDIFEAKIAKSNITSAFPNYAGGQNYEEASTFIKDQFLSLNDNESKCIYSYVTCATDTKNIEFVFTSVKAILIDRAFNNVGL